MTARRPAGGHGACSSGRVAVSFAAGLVAVLIAHGAQAACTLGAVAVLPVHQEHDGQVIPVEINGRAANLVIDTGAFATTIKRAAADRLGVRMNELDTETYGIGGVRHTYRGFARTMRVGNMQADGMTLAGVDMMDRPTDSGVDGLFGMNMMAAYDIDLDFAGGHVVIYEADGGCSKPTVALAQPLYIVPLEYIEHDRQADIEVVIDGHRVRAVLDSGASHTVMFRSAAGRLGVDLSALRAPGHHLGFGIGPQAVPALEHVFGSVRIGDLTINNMRIDVLDQANMGVSLVHVGSRLADPSLGEPGGEEMLLGADFMRKVHLWISHSSGRLIMQYPPQPSVLPH